MKSCLASIFAKRFKGLKAENAAVADNHLMQGDAYFREFKEVVEGQNRLPQAINAYMMASELNDDADIQARIARAYLLNGQFEMASKTLDKLHSRDDLYPHTIRTMLEATAFLQFRQGNIQEAKMALYRALHYDAPWKTAKVHLGLVSVYLQQARTASKPACWAMAALHLAVGATLFPLTESMASMKPVGAFLALMLTKRFRSADTLLQRLLDLYQQYPGSPLLAVEIGQTYLRNEQYAEAEYWFYRAVRRHPAKDEGYRCLANYYRTTSNPDQLIETLYSWLQIRPNNGDILFALSQELSQQPENAETAVRLAKQALLVLTEPESIAAVYAHLGALYSGMQCTDTAIMAYQSAVSAYPNHLDTCIQLGTLYYDKQEYALSQKVFEKALALSPENPKILCNLGYLAWMQGNIQQAQRYYHRSIDLDPTYDIALNNLGVLYLDHIGNIERAMAYFDQTLEYNPEYALCHYNRGRAYSFLGKTIEAARCFSLAKTLNENSQELDGYELAERIQQLFEHTEEKPISD